MVEETESLWERALEKGARTDFKACKLFLKNYKKRDEVRLGLKWSGNVVSMAK